MSHADPQSSPSISGLHALAKVRELIQSGSFDDALDLCHQGAEAHPDQAVAFLLLAGHANLGKEAYSDALKAYEKVLGIESVGQNGGLGGERNVEAWNGVLQVHRARGDLEGSVSALESVLKLTPEDSPGDIILRIELAERYAELGEYEKSQQLFWHVLSGMPIGSDERLDCLCKMADSMLKQRQTHVDFQVEEQVKRSGSASAIDAASPTADAPPASATCGSEAVPNKASGINKVPSMFHADINRDIDTDTATVQSISCIKLDVMAAQAAQDDEAHNVGVSLNHVLTEIMETSPASLKYLRYREEYLRRCLLRIFHHPPRSTERQQYRLAAVRECVKILCTGGQCSCFAFEAAVWLLEEEEEVSGCQQEGSGTNNTVAFAVENFARRMYHQFPCNPTAKTLLVMMMRRRQYSRSQADRLVLEAMLEEAMREDVGDGESPHHIDCASGFRALAELHYENRHYAKSHDVSLRGLTWLQERRDRGHESLSQVGLGLRLMLAKSLRRLGKLDEAEAQFQALSGWVSEGEIGFGELCGSLPTSIHQQSLRGIALVAVERGDIDAAMSQYERILGKASLGRAKAEHWAHADYGWLLYQRGDVATGDLEQARVHLEKAIEVAEEEGSSATDSQIAEHHYRLGEVYWKLSVAERSSGLAGNNVLPGENAKLKQLAYTQFYESAKVESHFQASALAALGRHYESEGNAATAQRCFKKALAIDPGLDLAGELLCRHLLRQGKKDEELIQFLLHLSGTQSAATWTHREIGAAEMRLRHWEKAIAYLLKAVKLRERDAMSWENLGLCFFNMGRLESAKKAIARALAIDSTRSYSRVVMAWVDMVGSSGASSLAQGKKTQDSRTLGNPVLSGSKSLHDLELLSLAYRHFKDALRHLFKGAIDTCRESLAACGRHASSCSSNILSANKLLGDVAFLRLKLAGVRLGCTGADEGRDEARRWYAKAIHLAPNQACLYRNLCIEMPNIVDPDVAERCVEASLRLSMNYSTIGNGSNGADDAQADLSSSWSAAGTLQGSRYALIRALMLDRKDFQAWQALEALPSTSEDERMFCRTNLKQLHKEENDVFARVLTSKMDPESSESDLFSRMQVAEILGPELMSLYLSDPYNPMRSTVAELVNLLTYDTVIDVRTTVEIDAGTNLRVDLNLDVSGNEHGDVDEVDSRKGRHQRPWLFQD